MKKINPISQRIHLRHLLLAASLVLFGTIVFGGIFKANGPSSGCPDWPTCFGRWMPPALESEVHAVSATYDYLHRFATALVTLLILAAIFIAHQQGQRPRLFYGLSLGLGLIGIEIGLGAWLALRTGLTSQSWVSAVHLSLSLVTLGILVAASATEFHTDYLVPQSTKNSGGGKFSLRSSFPRLASMAVGGVFLLLVSGILVAATGASTACPAWPLCGQGLVPSGMAEWLQFTHRVS